MALRANLFVLLLYIVGVASVVYHWSNGLWTAAITWGVTTSAASQQRFKWVCAGLFVALASFSTIAIAGSLMYEPTQAETEAMRIMTSDDKPDFALVADEDGMIIPGATASAHAGH